MTTHLQNYIQKYKIKYQYSILYLPMVTEDLSHSIVLQQLQL